MQELIDYIIGSARVRYVEWHPHNEAIVHMYAAIVAAVREKAETLTVTRDHILFGKAGVARVHEQIGWHERKCKPIKPGEKSLSYTCFRDALTLILEHDAEVRKYLELVESTPERATYQIVFHEQDV